MHGFRNRAIIGLITLTSILAAQSIANAQYPYMGGGYGGAYGGGNPCNPCAAAAAVAPVIQAPVAYAPAYQTAAVSDCPCMKPVTETVYQDVQQIDYVPVKKTVQRPKVVTTYEDRDVTQYQRVTEARTVNVPSYQTQQVTQCVQQTQNRSYWRTSYQPRYKVSPCQYDPRTGFMGELNRLGLSFRNSFTPNYTARREFVPNVVATSVPVTRTVQIPTTRQVTYNVARMVPTTVKQRVAVNKTIMEDVEITAYEPRTTTKRVAVGTRTRMVYSTPDGSTTAANPTPATAAGGEGPTKLQSNPTSRPIPLRSPTYPTNSFRRQPQEQPVRQAQPEPTPAAGPVAKASNQPTIRMTGWQSTRPERATPVTQQRGPLLTLNAK